MDAVRLWLVLALVLIAAVWDLREARIPNALTYGALLLALPVSFFSAAVGPGAVLTGAALGFFPAFLLFALGGVGGGDVKLLAAVGALVGYPLMIDVLFYSIVVGTGISLGMIIWQGRTGELAVGLMWQLRRLFYRGLEPVMPVDDLRVPFAVAVAGGYLWVLLVPASSLISTWR